MKRDITNWNNYPVKNAELLFFDSLPELRDQVTTHAPLIARGLGRCYGDASLQDTILATVKYDKAVSFDKSEGVFECQSGLSLDEVLKIIVPRGWFLPVTPGTKFITVGGAIASDIHGKNHHIDGSFSNHVLGMQLMLADGSLVSCGPTDNVDLFRATCGGMGLTGVILRVRFKLKKIESSYIIQKQVKASSLDELLEHFENYKYSTYSVAWIDCLKKGRHFGRSILMLGEHANLEDLSSRQSKNPLATHGDPRLGMPFNLPSFVLNKFSVKAFNTLYYRKNVRPIQENVVHYDPYFYPLDFIHSWNRMYGRKGFVQYQFVVPMDAVEGLVQIMTRISRRNMGSFLTVLKVFGPQDSLISFPMKGYTLALDFPVEDGLFDFLDELDALVADHGGRVYLTKDARMNASFFKESYPGYEEFVKIVRQYDPEGKFNSMLADRLSIK